jgi:hypothetical protein
MTALFLKRSNAAPNRNPQEAYLHKKVGIPRRKFEIKEDPLSDTFMKINQAKINAPAKLPKSITCVGGLIFRAPC